jgi:hypothetical protein
MISIRDERNEPQIKISITKAAARKDQASFPLSVGGRRDSCSTSSFHLELESSSKCEWSSDVGVAVTSVDRVPVVMID